MSLPTQIAVGDHAIDGEITDLQACAQAWLAGHVPAITDFDGADPTGKQDSSAAFAAAFLSIGRSLLYVPPGSYRVDAGGIVPPSGASLMGAGLNATTINYAGTGAAVLLDGCIGSRVAGLKIVTSDSSATVRGVHLKNTSAASEFNRIDYCWVIQNNATGRNAGQYGILLEDNSSSVLAQFWNTVRGCKLFSWETCIGLLQSGSGKDGVNQNRFDDNMCAAFITGMLIPSRCGDNVITGLFGTHSSASAFTDTLLVIGDTAGADVSAGNIATGLISDMGASGSAFNLRAKSLNNIVFATNESSGTDVDAGTGNFAVSSKNLSGLSQRFTLPNFRATSSSAIAGTLLCSKIQDTQSRTVADADVTLSTGDFLVTYTSITADRTVTLPAPSIGLNLIFSDGSGNSSGTKRIILSGNINGSATTAVAVATANGCSMWRATAATWFKTGTA